MDYIEFLAKIKEKYPQYADIDDKLLAEKMIEKYPQYAEQVTFEEKPEPKKAKSTGKVDIKDYFADELAKRKEWEENHPIISNIQKDFQPGYRARQREMELRSKYGYKAPLKEELKAALGEMGDNLIPAVNTAVAIGTGGMGAGAKGLLPQIGKGALQGSIQGGVLGLTHDLGDNGVNVGNIGETLKGATIGSLIGGLLPAGGAVGGAVFNKGGELLKRGAGKLAQISPETVEQVIKPMSKALDYTRATASDTLRSTTERVRDAYNNLLRGKGEAISTAEDNLRNVADRVNIQDVLNDIKGTFDQYQGENINAARNLTGNLENDLYDLVESAGKRVENPPTVNTPNPDIQAEQELLKEYNTFKNSLNKKYGSIGNLKEIANNDIKQNAMYGERFDSLDDYRNLLSYEQLLQDAKYIDNRIPSSVNGELLGDGNIGAISQAPTPKEAPLTISPIDLQKIKQQVGQMTNWADTTRPKIQNTVLEQVYGQMKNRLEDLSPELAKANKDFAYLKGFQEDEGLKTILAPGGAIDKASTALKNYNSTVSKGNTAQNIQALENTLVKNGEQPFLSTMDDINAAMDLLKQERTGLGSIAELGKSIITRPALKLARAYNRSSIPNKLYNIKTAIKGLAVPLMYRPQLQGNVEYNDYDE